MDYGQIEAALAGMRAAGWQHTAPLVGSIMQRCHRERRGQWGKVIRLWCILADAGTVRDRSEAAMLEWARRHLDEDLLEWAGARSLSRCIEGLKDWAAREGVELD
jgi:alkylated DNA nucleotide flippase Atl1